MIEVEKKFKLDKSQISQLIDGTQFLKEVQFEDTYYDNENFDFIKKDTWLRKRNHTYQLKTPLSFNNNRLLDQYKETELESEIIQLLNLDQSISLEQNIAVSGLNPFCKCLTTRKKYKSGQFIIDIDEVDYGDFQYSICEVELLVADESNVDFAIQQILEFANKHNLEVAPVRGKVVEYIRIKYPELYINLFDS